MEAENPNLDLEKTASHVLPPALEKTDSKPIVDSSSEHASISTDPEKGARDPPAGPQTVHGNEEPEYPSTKKLIPIVGSLYMAFFLVALVSSLTLSPPSHTNHSF